MKFIAIFTIFLVFALCTALNYDDLVDEEINEMILGASAESLNNDAIREDEIEMRLNSMRDDQIGVTRDGSNIYEDCAPGWVYSRSRFGMNRSGACYKIFFTKMSYAAASQVCSAHESYVVAPDTADESDFVGRMPGLAHYKANPYIWIGNNASGCRALATGYHGKSFSYPCTEKLGFVCKKAPLLKNEAMDQPVNFTMMSWQKAVLGECSPTNAEMVFVHQVCLNNWRELYYAGGTVAKLETQCPSFCDKPNNDGSCVWKIACKRCEDLIQICSRAVPVCQGVIAENKQKSDTNRCPQFEMCYPPPSQMEFVRKTCEQIYSDWEKEAAGGVSIYRLRNPCKVFCDRIEEGCALKYACKKCTLLVMLTRRGRREEFKQQFETIMSIPAGQRCNNYRGPLMPFWWITGNWL